MYKLPGQDSQLGYGWVYTISLTFWIMIGLAWAAAMIANLQEIYKSIAHPEEEFDKDEHLEDYTVTTKVLYVNFRGVT